MGYYEVIAKCGHVGRNRYYEGHFFVMCCSKEKAAGEVKAKSRVKRDHKDCILSVTEISYFSYIKGKEDMSDNPYFLCKSRYEQNNIWNSISDRVFYETERQQERLDCFRRTRSRSVYTDIYRDGLRLRNPYKYCKMRGAADN